MDSRDEVWDGDDLVVPSSLPMGAFRPLMCCMCGVLLRKARHVFVEGTICGSCRFIISGAARHDAKLAPATKGGAQ